MEEVTVSSAGTHIIEIYRVNGVPRYCLVTDANNAEYDCETDVCDTGDYYYSDGKFVQRYEEFGNGSGSTTIPYNPPTSNCDDGDPCTTIDRYDTYCNCLGEYHDSDDDGVCDGLDNCPYTSNPNQTDSDGDGDGDVCEDGNGGNGSGCSDIELTLTITFDDYPSETDWEIKSGATIIESEGNYSNSQAGNTIQESICVEDGCYDLVFYDLYDDGICCDYGNGSYTLTDSEGTVLVTGGQFSSSATDNFCVSPSGCSDDDNDGVCNEDDICPNGDDNIDTDRDSIPDACDPYCNIETGAPCDDGNICTVNDTITVDCNCVGTPLPDSDGDGLCDSLDYCDDNTNVAEPRSFVDFVCQENSNKGTSIIINEFSNGSNGTKEYIELLVVNQGGDCGELDLRGFILDDNNGEFSHQINGVGITPGHIRFTNSSIWEQVPIGSIILIYNPDDKNPAIKIEDDPRDSNTDGVYVLPINHYLLAETISSPTLVAPIEYRTSDKYKEGSWNSIWAFDEGDAIQIRNCNGAYLHGFSYGDPKIFNGGPDQLFLHPTIS